MEGHANPLPTGDMSTGTLEKKRVVLAEWGLIVKVIEEKRTKSMKLSDEPHSPI